MRIIVNANSALSTEFYTVHFCNKKNQRYQKLGVILVFPAFLYAHFPFYYTIDNYNHFCRCLL